MERVLRAVPRNNIIYDVIYNIIPAISRARMQKRVRPAYAYADDISFSVWYTYILYYIIRTNGGLYPAAAAVVVAVAAAAGSGRARRQSPSRVESRYPSVHVVRCVAVVGPRVS